CDGDRDCGIGKGDVWFYTDDKGHPVKYTWKAHPGQDTHYCKHDAKDCDCKKSCKDDAPDKCELEGIVIGRVLDCKANK
ncbi:MAG: hypothetical protein U9Q12_04025, partial [Patescibacteria group bacterium]|nr:hypothetical protein [Patescibacteria group bacterium]